MSNCAGRKTQFRKGLHTGFQGFRIKGWTTIPKKKGLIDPGSIGFGGISNNFIGVIVNLWASHPSQQGHK